MNRHGHEILFLDTVLIPCDHHGNVFLPNPKMHYFCSKLQEAASVKQMLRFGIEDAPKEE